MRWKTSLVFLGFALAFMPFSEAWAGTMKFDNTRLLVNKFDETFLFFQDKLGLKANWGKPGDVYAQFAFPGGGEIGLFKRELMAKTVGKSNLPSSVPAQDTFALIIRVENVDQTYRKLKAAGISFVNEPSDKTDWGIRVAHLRDPDGDLLEIFSEIKKK